MPLHTNTDTQASHRYTLHTEMKHLLPVKSAASSDWTVHIVAPPFPGFFVTWGSGYSPRMGGRSHLLSARSWEQSEEAGEPCFFF